MLDIFEVGRQIAQHRRQARLTQEELAGRARVSRATIAALERGTARELGFRKVTQILGVLQLDLRITTANTSRPTLEDLREEKP